VCHGRHSVRASKVMQALMPQIITVQTIATQAARVQSSSSSVCFISRLERETSVAENVVSQLNEI
jgi:hypothetical protein